MFRPAIAKMTNPIKAIALVPPVNAAVPDPVSAKNTAAPAAPVAEPDQPLRLVVEPAAGSAHGYTYKLFDRTTGALLIELPREAASQMSASPTYTAGQVIDAKA